MSAFRRAYGAGVVHLLAHGAGFALAVYALSQIIGGGSIGNFAVWFVGAAVLHDLVFFPLYTVLDHLTHHGVRRRARARWAHAINYVRVPGLISGLLLLIYFPLILGLPDHTYFRTTGHHLQGYARNWLLITAALFASSAVVYLVRSRDRRAGRRSVQ